MAAVLAVNGGAVLGGRGGTTVSINYRVLISISLVKAC